MTTQYLILGLMSFTIFCHFIECWVEEELPKMVDFRFNDNAAIF